MHQAVFLNISMKLGEGWKQQLLHMKIKNANNKG